MRNQDKRLKGFEEKLSKEIETIREQGHKAVETLEDFSKKEITLLVERLKAEQTQREAMKQTSEQIAEVAKHFDKRAAGLEEQITQAQHLFGMSCWSRRRVCGKRFMRFSRRWGQRWIRR